MPDPRARTCRPSDTHHRLALAAQPAALLGGLRTFHSPLTAFQRAHNHTRGDIP